LALFAAMSCEKEFVSPIPNSVVNIDLDLNGRDAVLRSPGTVKTITQPRLESERLGFGGILVTNGYFGSALYNIYAYDLACPMEAPDRVSRLVPDDIGQAECPVCHTVYNISDGNGFPVSGSSPYPLKSYRVFQTSSGDPNRFYIKN